MKNYILNKKLFNWLPIGVIFLLSLAFFMSLFITGVVWAQSEPNLNTVPEVSTSASVSDSFGLNIFRPYLVKIIDGESETNVSTAYQDSSDILKSAGINVYPEDEYSLKPDSAHNNEPLVGYRLVIDRATQVQLSLRGVNSVARTQGETVANLLSEKGVVLGATDVVKPALDTKITSGLKVSVFRVGTQSVTLEEDVKFESEFIDDANKDYGYLEVKTAGVNGRAKVTYEITYYDGVEVSKVKTLSITLKEAVKEVIVRGTKGIPVSNGPLSAAQIQFLGGCEAGMNPTRNSGNGYYGAFQFSIGTWNAMGTGYARADLAPLDVQIAAVQQLLSNSSIFGQFPGCANQMVANGLLQK